MRRKTKRQASDAVHQIGNQSRVMRKMSMQMIDLLACSPFFREEHVNEMNRLKKALPAIAGGIAFIDLLIERDINQGTDVALKIPPGHFCVLPDRAPPGSRLCGFSQVMHRGPHLVNLCLNGLLMRIRQSEDLKGDSDLFQRKDLVQDKGL